MHHIRTLSEITRRMTLLEPFPFEEKHVTPLGEAARQRAAAYVRLAYKLAWTFAHQHARDMPIDDLKAEALCGLTYASGLFKEEYEVPFGAYAMRVMRQRLTQAVIRWRKAKRVGLASRHLCDDDSEPKARPEPDVTEALEVHDMCEQVRRVIPARWYEVLYQYHGEGQTLEAISQQLGVTRQRVRQLLSNARDRARRQFPEWTSF